MSANLFYVDLYNGKACKSSSGDAMTFPDVVAGGTLSYGLRWLEYVGGFNEVEPNLAALRVSLGAIDARPVSGRYKLKVGGGAGNSTNTTGFLDWCTSSSAIQSALNSLSARPADFTCDEVNGSVLIRRDDGGESVISITSNRLIPRSFGRVYGSETDGGWVYDLRLTQSPLSFSDSATRILPEAPSISTIQDGGADPSGSTIWNEIQALKLPPNFRGTFQLRYGYGKTILLDPTDGPAELEAALNTILAMNCPAGNGRWSPLAGSCSVTNPATNIAHIEFNGGLSGENMDPLEVRVFSAPPGDWTFDLPMNLAELREAMRDKAEMVIPFEAEADFYLNPDNHDAGTVTRKLWSTTLKVRRPLIWPGMAVVPGVDWLFPNPVDYTPFSADQVITGQQHYATTVGDGTATEFVITHGLATTDISGIVVRDNTTGAIMEPAAFDATINGADTVTLTFASAPSVITFDQESEEYIGGVRAIITAAGPTSAFQQHHHTMEAVGDTVDGVFIPTLQNVIDDFGGRIETLESLIGRQDVVLVVSGNKRSEFSLPNVGEILPDMANEDSGSTMASQISVPPTEQLTASVTISGTDLEAKKAEEAMAAAISLAVATALEEANKKAAEASAAEAAMAAVPPKATNVITRLTFPALQLFAAIPATPEIPSAGNTPATPGTAEVPAVPLAWPAPRNGGKLPWLLPAINDSSATTAAVLPTSPLAGCLYSATGSFALPGGAGRKMQNVISGNKFGYDGRCFYRVVANGDSWSALEMERELLRAIIRPEQFPASSDLALSWAITASLVCDQVDAAARDIARTVDGAQYLLVTEAVPIPDASTPGTPGLNLGAEGTAVRLGTARISLSPAREEHNFSLALNRDAAGAGTGTLTRYGVAAPVPTLPAGAFVLRVRLTAFDVDDTSANPRGQVTMGMPASQLTVEKN